MMDTDTEQLLAAALAARAPLAASSGAARDLFLTAFAAELRERESEIRAVNEKDVAEARAAGLSDVMVDRLDLSGGNYGAMASAVEAVRELPDPIGAVHSSRTTDNGLTVAKMNVPLGLICFIYESRPSVTAEGAALCVKSGNSVILRGGSEALRSNLAVASAARQALAEAGLPEGALAMLPTSSREQIDQLLVDPRLDLIIPRGGHRLVKHVKEVAKAPVLAHLDGNCHLYVERSADLDMARKLVANSKCQRPSTCNALESLLVDEAVAADFLPQLAEKLTAGGVELVGCERSVAIMGDACAPASEEDWSAEFLDLKLSVKVVAGLDEAIAWINTHGSHHTDGIVTSDSAAAGRFQREVDSSSVLLNTSTRFADGFMYGLGAETGISTGKLHARGPVGLQGLTSEKWIVVSDGALRG